MAKEKTTDGRLLDEKRRGINARLKELRRGPLVEEYERLEAAAAALAGISASSASASQPRRVQPRAAKPKRSSVAASTRGRRGRPKGSGKRAEQALALVTAQPGITIPEIAERIGIKHNYLYRVWAGLADDGRVKKHGRGWHPVKTA